MQGSMLVFTIFFLTHIRYNFDFSKLLDVTGSQNYADQMTEKMGTLISNLRDVTKDIF